MDGKEISWVILESNAAAFGNARTWLPVRPIKNHESADWVIKITYLWNRHIPRNRRTKKTPGCPTLVEDTYKTIRRIANKYHLGIFTEQAERRFDSEGAFLTTNFFICLFILMHCLITLLWHIFYIPTSFFSVTKATTVISKSSSFRWYTLFQFSGPPEKKGFFGGFGPKNLVEIRTETPIENKPVKTKTLPTFNVGRVFLAIHYAIRSLF